MQLLKESYKSYPTPAGYLLSVGDYLHNARPGDPPACDERSFIHEGEMMEMNIDEIETLKLCKLKCEKCGLNDEPLEQTSDGLLCWNCLEDKHFNE